MQQRIEALSTVCYVRSLVSKDSQQGLLVGSAPRSVTSCFVFFETLFHIDRSWLRTDLSKDRLIPSSIVK